MHYRRPCGTNNQNPKHFNLFRKSVELGLIKIRQDFSNKAVLKLKLPKKCAPKLLIEKNIRFR